MRFVRRFLPVLGCLALVQACSTIEAAPGHEPAVGRADAPQDSAALLARIDHVVVIYGENRSFDNLFGSFPGADGVAQSAQSARTQLDRDGRPLRVLPPVWSEAGAGTEARFGREIPNGPFAIDGPPARLPLTEPTRDLVHRYYQNIEQIDGGRNDFFAAISDAGALTMGHYDGSRLAMWAIAREFTLADRFFMGAFGGSFMNHQWFACACVAQFENAPEAMKSVLAADGRLARKPGSPASALDGPVQWVRDAALTPDGFAINTVQPPYQPSAIPPAPGGEASLANAARHPLPPQESPTIGDRLSEKGVRWAWYSGAWNAALADGTQAPEAPRRVIYNEDAGSPDFQPHHQPYNYFRAYAPGTAARAEHLRDYQDLLADLEAGRLPQVVFYKPQGDLNEHSGYANVASGDAHIAELIGRIRASSAWSSTLIIVTYDENGGYWDHVAPPSGDGWSDRWGPGTRIPAILVSPLVKKGFVDHTVYDTGSIHRLLIRRFGLRPLPDLRTRMGDLTNALDVR